MHYPFPCRLILERWLAYAPPTPEQTENLKKMRAAATDFVTAVCENVPPSADRTVALRKIKEALMTANAALVAPWPQI